MLTSLSIKNFALIDTACVEFGKGLNVLTGETGAGKSIIVDALRFALGERAASSQVRDTAKESSVEAVFDLAGTTLVKNEKISEFFQQDEPTLIIRRSFSSDGRNKIKINGSAVTVGQLKEIGDLLVDFHGPNDHQMLLAQEAHLAILDRLCDFGTTQDEYAGQFEQYVKLQRDLEILRAAAANRERDLDILTHQLKELKQVSLEKEKYEYYFNEQNRLNNLETISANAAMVLNILEDENAGATEQLRKAFQPLNALNRVDPSTQSFAGNLESAVQNCRELAAAIKNYVDDLSFDQENAALVNRNCDIYKTLLKKYGPAIEDAQIFFETAQRSFNLLSNADNNDATLQEKIETCRVGLNELAGKLSREREKIAKALEGTIKDELAQLGIAKCAFECRIEKTGFNTYGFDAVTFYISPNPGEPLKPLAEIVSSGEAARLMLALKKALIDVDPVPILVFDEIDASIGGRLGSVTGKKLKELAARRQVLLITHLPQIAAFADSHFKIAKTSGAKHTATSVNRVDADERIKELAKMMSGEKETDISLAHAKDLLVQVRKAK